MIDLQFRIRASAFGRSSLQHSVPRPILLLCRSIEEAALICEIDAGGRMSPNRAVFQLSFSRGGPVIEGFQDNALGEFVKAQIETRCAKNGLPKSCEIPGLDSFLEPVPPDQAGRFRDLISICEFRPHEFTPESAVQFLKDSGFTEEFIIVGVKKGSDWRRSRCITTFEGRPADVAAILGYLAEFFGRGQGKDKPH